MNKTHRFALDCIENDEERLYMQRAWRLGLPVCITPATPGYWRPDSKPFWIFPRSTSCSVGL
jgi:hypothetical protein